MSKALLYESVFYASFPFALQSVFYFHFLMSQHPRQTKKIPTRYTHFGIRHARSIPIPMEISNSPHSHSVGAPFILLRIPSPPFFYFYAENRFPCKQKAQVKDLSFSF